MRTNHFQLEQFLVIYRAVISYLSIKGHVYLAGKMVCEVGNISRSNGTHFYAKLGSVYLTLALCLQISGNCSH